MAAMSDFLLPTDTSAPFARGVTGAPKAVLRLEALAVLGLAVLGYQRTGGSWLIFAVLFLAPDLSMLGYLAGRRLGAVAYNAAHSYLGPAVLAAYGLIAASQPAIWAALIWTAHIGFDRALGYGLKYASAFGDTHLGRVGRAAGR